MKRYLLIFALLAGVLATPDALADDRALLIENATIIHPGTLAMERGNVLVRDGRIVEVSGRAIEADDARILDATGRYLVPGLIDSHYHTGDIPGLGSEFFGPYSRHPGMVAAYYRQQPRSLLYYGITTIVDPAPFSDAGARHFRGSLAPVQFHCGAAVLPDGYPMVFASDPHAPSEAYVLDPRAEDFAVHAGNLIKRMKEDGAICVKLFIENGFGRSDQWPLPPDELIDAIVEAAHERGMKVLMHANALDMQRIALEHDTDILAHGLWNWLEFTGKPGLPAPIRDHLDQVIAQDVAVQSTIRVMAGLVAMFEPGTLDDPAGPKVLPSKLLRWYETDEANWFRETLREDGATDEQLASGMRMIQDQGQRAAAYLAEHGATLLLGSDQPSSPTWGNWPGYSTYLEMRHMADAGIPLGTILAAATIDNARAFGLEQDFGSVTPGRVANLLILEKNPLETIDAYDSIEWVIVRGKPVSRETLRADHADKDGASTPE